MERLLQKNLMVHWDSVWISVCVQTTFASELKVVAAAFSKNSFLYKTNKVLT